MNVDEILTPKADGSMAKLTSIGSINKEKSKVERAKIINEIKRSASSELVKVIANTMRGNTFHHHFHILYDLRTLLGPGKKIYAEIGTFYGGSLCFMLQHDFDTEYYSIDPEVARPDQGAVLNDNIKTFNRHSRTVHRHKKYSNDIKLIEELKQVKFKTDILFIDGDHGFEGVVSDFIKYKDFVNEGGFIVFDDYNDHKYSPWVKRAVDYIVSVLNNNYIVIGDLPNIKSAYDSLGLTVLNEFIIRKSNLISGPDYIIRGPKSPEIRFGIVMATYRRPTGKTPEYITTCLHSILQQKYTKWDIVVVGDKYELEGEILQILEDFRGRTANRIIYLSNPLVERDYIRNRQKLWCVAGARSMNIGLNYLRHNGYQYYSHIDDDDHWTPEHLQSFYEIYKKYPTCVFINSQSNHMGRQLPNFKCAIAPNNFIPSVGKLIHSSVSFRSDIIPYDYFTTFDENVKIGVADGTYWDNVRTFLQDHPQYCSIYTSKLTCNHLIERESVK